MKIAYESEVTLIDKMGSDLSVVNAARVSFAKEKELFDPSDEKLINYLARHNHFTPFCHAFASFRIKAPLFVARQLVKHQVGLSWNEVSRRYVDSNPEFYLPREWRGRSESAKQGSSRIPVDISGEYLEAIHTFIKTSRELYETLLKKNVCPEQARMMLPQNMMTEWIWSGTIMAFSRVCTLRMKADAQYETQEVARYLHDALQELYPVSWKALQNTGH